MQRGKGGREMSDTDAAEANRRAEWLHKHKAPKDWIVLTTSEVSVIREELLAVERERDEARHNLELCMAANSDVARIARERDEAQATLTDIHRWIERNHPDGFIDSMTFHQNLERVGDRWYDRLDQVKRERNDYLDRLNEILKPIPIK
jgi:hypothetical protein